MPTNYGVQQGIPFCTGNASYKEKCGFAQGVIRFFFVGQGEIVYISDVLEDVVSIISKTL